VTDPTLRQPLGHGVELARHPHTAGVGKFIRNVNQLLLFDKRRRFKCKSK